MANNEKPPDWPKSIIKFREAYKLAKDGLLQFKIVDLATGKVSYVRPTLEQVYHQLQLSANAMHKFNKTPIILVGVPLVSAMYASYTDYKNKKLKASVELLTEQKNLLIKEVKEKDEKLERQSKEYEEKTKARKEKYEIKISNLKEEHKEEIKIIKEEHTKDMELSKTEHEKVLKMILDNNRETINSLNLTWAASKKMSDEKFEANTADFENSVKEINKEVVEGISYLETVIKYGTIITVAWTGCFIVWFTKK